MYRIILLLLINTSCSGQYLEKLQLFGAYGFSNYEGNSTRYDNPKGFEFGLNFNTLQKSNFFLHLGLSFIKTGTRSEASFDSSLAREHDFYKINVPITLSYNLKGIRPEIGFNLNKNLKTKTRRSGFLSDYYELDGYFVGDTPMEYEVNWNPFSLHYGFMFSFRGAHFGFRFRTFSSKVDGDSEKIKEYQLVIKYDI